MALVGRHDFEYSGQDGLFRNNLWLFVNMSTHAQIIIMLISSLSADFWVTMFQILNIGINATNNQLTLHVISNINFLSHITWEYRFKIDVCTVFKIP